MSDAVKVAVIYYSATGSVHTMAARAAQAAEKAGAEVRLVKVAELAPAEAIASNAAWAASAAATADIPVATSDDIDWADVVLFGTPTRYGNIAAQLKQYLDTLGPLWAQGKLANKVYAGFTSTGTKRGGQETTLLALYNSVYHFGGIIVPPGYTDPAVKFNDGNPYGVSHVSFNGAVDARRGGVRRARPPRAAHRRRWPASSSAAPPPDLARPAAPSDPSSPASRRGEGFVVRRRVSADGCGRGGDVAEDDAQRHEGDEQDAAEQHRGADLDRLPSTGTSSDDIHSETANAPTPQATDSVVRTTKRRWERASSAAKARSRSSVTAISLTRRSRCRAPSTRSSRLRLATRPSGLRPSEHAQRPRRPAWRCSSSSGSSPRRSAWAPWCRPRRPISASRRSRRSTRLPTRCPSPRGTLLRSEPLGVEVPGGAAYRILYVSQTADGVVGGVRRSMLFVPSSPASGRGSARRGVGARHRRPGRLLRCPRDRRTRCRTRRTGSTQMLSLGWVVVSTDYVGLGTPGTEQYLRGAGGGARRRERGARGARLPGRRRPAPGGWRGGTRRAGTRRCGRGTWPASSHRSSSCSAWLRPRPRPSSCRSWPRSGAAPSDGSSARRSRSPGRRRRPRVSLDGVLSDAGAENYRRLADECVTPAASRASSAATSASSSSRSTRRRDRTGRQPRAPRPSPCCPRRCPPTSRRARPTRSVLPGPNALLQQRWCAAGSALTVLWMGGVSHQAAAVTAGPDAVAWMADRFAGVRAGRTCDTPIPVPASAP